MHCPIRVELATPEQAGKLGGRDDRHATVVGGLEILVPRHKILWWRDRGEQIKEGAILLVRITVVVGRGIIRSGRVRLTV